MSGPRIYKAINAVMAELAEAGIAKSHTNVIEQYQYRSIDDVLNRLAPLLVRHRLCVLPRVLERTSADRIGVRGEVLTNVTLRVAFDLVCAVDQSQHTIEAFGEALDGGDKGTSKAMSAAYKGAMLQTFCIPVAGNNDADADSPKLRVSTHEPPPVQGWEQWSYDIIEIIGSCESEEALGRVQDSHRSTLKALSRERTELYTQIGDAFASRFLSLRSNPSAPVPEHRGRADNGDVSSTAARSPTKEPIHAQIRLA